MFEHEPRPPHSVLKMMRDMYSTRTTASIFYTNDERVVCDIIIRQLTDLPSDDKVCMTTTTRTIFTAAATCTITTTATIICQLIRNYQCNQISKPSTVLLFQRRNEYLHLLWGVVEAGGWQEHQHRRSEVSTCCSNILAEEEPTAHKDQALVRKLLDAFPEFFADSNQSNVCVFECMCVCMYLCTYVWDRGREKGASFFSKHIHAFTQRQFAPNYL